MKRKKINKHFSLNKQTVANLTDFEQQRVVAGGERCEETECVFSNSAVLFSSSEYVNTHTDIMPADKRLWPCIAQGTTVTIG